MWQAGSWRHLFGDFVQQTFRGHRLWQLQDGKNKLATTRSAHGMGLAQQPFSSYVCLRGLSIWTAKTMYSFYSGPIDFSADVVNVTFDVIVYAFLGS
eukprot:scaffold71756_cov32-Prasinocladus_malaysianus.AAC.1